jgi:hypothetical protein
LVDKTPQGEVTNAPQQEATQAKSLGFGARFRINMLYQQIINGHGTIVSFFCSLFKPKAVDAEEIQNFGLAANMIVGKKAADTSGAAVQPSDTTGTTFFSNISCDQKMFFQSLLAIFEQVKASSGTGGKSQNTLPPGPDDIADERGESSHEMLAEEINFENLSEGGDDSLKLHIEKRVRDSYSFRKNKVGGLENLGSPKKFAKDDSELIRTNKGEHKSPQFNARRPERVARPKPSTFDPGPEVAVGVAPKAEPSRELTDADEVTSGRQPSQEPISELVIEPEGSHVASETQPADSEDKPSESTNIDSPSPGTDTPPIDSIKPVQVNPNGDLMSINVLNALTTHNSCIIKGHAFARYACGKIDKIVDAALGKEYKLDTSVKHGYDTSPTVKFFNELKEYVDIVPTCNSGITSSDYYYTITIKPGFKIVKTDDQFYVEKTENTPSDA